MTQPFYRAFEDRYRGERATIKERLRAYLPFLRPLAAWPHAAALDLGCGRGEWLELLGEEGFAARGIDLDEGMLAACRERGLDVENTDALAALRAQPDGSLALVSAFHLVEHIPFDLVRELIAEALRALQPGGLLIMETPNPENLVVGASDFYTDPSHERPIPPNLLSFAADHAGFARQKIVRLQEDPQLRAGGRVVLAAVLQGASPDYSVVAQKAALPNQLAPFDAAFATEYGIDLNTLARRYEGQRDDEHAEIHRILGRLDARISADRASVAAEQAAQQAALHATVDAAEQRLQGSVADLAARMARTEARLEQAEQRAERHAQHVVELLDSTSWRVTAPLRAASDVARRVRSAQREGRLASGARRHAGGALRRVALAVMRQPRAKRLALAVLARFPALRRRIHGVVYSAPGAGLQHGLPPEPLGGTPDDLPPRAARAYAALKAARDARRHKP
ncbi:class I SAM-dependent methyltransferase [Pseudoduganella chitinolytica]|uniref:Class I SAM-dependent methyltransferase n=1 Tax=Pseudoduganella chitinolytica TaxID=34070 RepID=A0ABY8BAJ9_9BURK|nr:class I SAM-dependent methyltransferase [Pseudoduganella chitinolytica]WEF32930.1 class I SAM-dependent methyltransferase [Pseudoduganella chitinolytica]